MAWRRRPRTGTSTGGLIATNHRYTQFKFEDAKLFFHRLFKVKIYPCCLFSVSIFLDFPTFFKASGKGFGPGSSVIALIRNTGSGCSFLSLDPDPDPRHKSVHKLNWKKIEKKRKTFFLIRHKIWIVFMTEGSGSGIRIRTGLEKIMDPDPDMYVCKIWLLHVYCSSLIITLALSSECRVFIEYLDSRKISQPSHGTIFSEHPGCTVCLHYLK